MAISNPGGNLNSVPAPTKQTQNSNYLDLTGTTASTNWAQQYVPDLMEKEAEVFGNRTISGFLAQVGAEESMTADQVVWSEQGRLHLSYIGNVKDHQNQDHNNNEPGGTIEIDTDIDGNATSTSAIDHGIRVNDLLLVASSQYTTQCIVTAVSADDVCVAVYNAGNTAGDF